MHHFEFQYQYQPEDLKAIRETNSEPVFSPATRLTVAACGFATSLLILGAVGAWIVLTFALIVGFSFAVIFASKMNAQSRGNREYQIRNLKLFDTHLVETSGNSQSVNSWDVFDELIETDRHFLLRHYQRIIAIPKRAISTQEIEGCRNLIADRIARQNCGGVAEFQNWIMKTGSPVFRFTWQPEDTRAIRTGKLASFGRRNEPRGSANSSGVVIIVVSMIAVIAAVGLQFSGVQLNSKLDDSTEIIGRILICLTALSLPFLSTWLWNRYTKFVIQNQPIQIPTEEICVSESGEFVFVGYESAVSKYDVAEITALYLSNSLLGFRLGHGAVNVIPVRAFVDMTTAREFLNRLHFNSQQADFRSKERGTALELEIETGNPYQPPRF